MPNKIEMSATVTMDSIVVAGNDQVTTDLDGETIGLQMANGIYFNLNPVGTSVWKLIQEPRKVRRIYEELINEYTVQPEVCERDLLALLQQLAEAQLVIVES